MKIKKNIFLIFKFWIHKIFKVKKIFIHLKVFFNQKNFFNFKIYWRFKIENVDTTRSKPKRQVDFWEGYFKI